ncbi:MAG TPA: hypothetical protein VFZ29_11845 [Solirubrobacterales bacterium]
MLKDRTRSALLLLLLLLPVIGGCGGTAENTTTAPDGSARIETRPSTASGPVANPTPQQARAWRAIGRRACEGMKPLQAAHHFEPAVRAAGAEERFIELVTEPDPAVEGSPGYPRLVAAFYATTLPEPQRVLAAAACAKELAAHG